MAFEKSPRTVSGPQGLSGNMGCDTAAFHRIADPLPQKRIREPQRLSQNQQPRGTGIGPSEASAHWGSPDGTQLLSVIQKSGKWAGVVTKIGEAKAEIRHPAPAVKRNAIPHIENASAQGKNPTIPWQQTAMIRDDHGMLIGSVPESEIATNPDSVSLPFL
jgi:hypothetical protein